MAGSGGKSSKVVASTCLETVDGIAVELRTATIQLNYDNKHNQN